MPRMQAIRHKGPESMNTVDIEIRRTGRQVEAELGESCILFEEIALIHLSESSGLIQMSEEYHKKFGKLWSFLIFSCILFGVTYNEFSDEVTAIRRTQKGRTMRRAGRRRREGYDPSNPFFRDPAFGNRPRYLFC